MIQKMKFPDALALAMSREMEADPSVFVFGVDVPDHRRTYGSGRGLLEKFGPKRFFGSPLSEAGATGVAVGAALAGCRPVHVHARADFLLLAMNQLVNTASNRRYISNGRQSVPLVVRAIIGRSWGQGAQHSKAMHGTLAHFPGLKVVLPSTPQDAYSLLRSSIRDDNPVIFFEHRWCYLLEDEVDDEFEIPLGLAALRRVGSDLTILSTSWMTVEAMHAAAILARDGVSVEVIDVRSVVPLDLVAIVASAEKTGRVIIVDHDWTFAGFAAELSALIVESCFKKLHAPPVRLGLAHAPCPTTLALESVYYPNAGDIVRAAEGLLGLMPVDLSGEEFSTYQDLFKGPF